MIRGIVGPEGIPTITVGLAGRSWRALIDTGFNGDLELPDQLRNAVDARFLCRIRSRLAGGQFLEESSYLVDFPFEGESLRAEATFVRGTQILIGTRLLRRHRLGDRLRPRRRTSRAGYARRRRMNLSNSSASRAFTTSALLKPALRAVLTP